MIVDSALYRAGVRVAVDCTKEDLGRIRDEASGAEDFVWVGMHQPDEDELNRVAEVFSLHPLAVEDALKAHQRPKLERYEEGLFLVLKTLWYVDEQDAVETGEINLFAGQDFVQVSETRSGYVPSLAVTFVGGRNGTSTLLEVAYDVAPALFTARM